MFSFVTEVFRIDIRECMDFKTMGKSPVTYQGRGT